MEQKISLVTRYLAISKAMQEELALGKDTDIGILISKRQACMDNIKEIDRSLGKSINPDRDKLFSISGDFKDAIDGHIEHIKSLFEKIAGIDADVIIMVKEKSRDIKAELLKMNSVGQAAKGYSSKEKCIPMYMDAKR